jgi:hypothetical protein
MGVQPFDHLLWIDTSGLQLQGFGTVFRRVAEPVVGGQHHQRVGQPDPTVQEPQEVSHRPVEPQEMIMGLHALGAESVVDIVMGGETYC